MYTTHVSLYVRYMCIYTYICRCKEMSPEAMQHVLTVTVTVTVTVTDCLLKHELQKSSHPSPAVSRLLRRPVQSSPT